MSTARRWNEAETKQALYLYYQLPFGQIHSRNPEIISLARHLNRTSSSIAMKLANFASLDPKITDSGRRGLDGASALDRKIWAEFNSDWARLIQEAEALIPPQQFTEQSLKDNAAPFVHHPYTGASTMTVITEQRVGQNFFRRAVLANFNNICCVTGIADPRLLSASHIVPWHLDEKNRHNPRNGLCLSGTFDRAFDRGLMSIDEGGYIRFSYSLLNNQSSATQKFFLPYEGKSLITAYRFDPDPAFLRWHRDNLFEISDI